MPQIRFVATGALCLLSALCAKVSMAQVVTIKVLTAGSSAQWGVFAEAADTLASTFGTPHHWTTGGAGAVLHDNRGATPAIPDEPGNLWVVWSVDAVGNRNVWAYLSVDSVAGVSAYQAVPRDTLVVTSCGAGQNLLQALLPGADDGSLDSSVCSALNGHILTAANTDIRPEDALFANGHAVTLGYSITNGIKGEAGQVAYPIPFGLSGADPISGSTIPEYTVLPIGAAPVIFFANTSNTAAGHLGQAGISLNINNGREGTSTNKTYALFSGTSCNGSIVGASGSLVPVTAILREPISGTMETAEFTNFEPTGSQEDNVTTNPLNQSCDGMVGNRLRGIGATNEVALVLANVDSVGYAFYSVEALPNALPSSPTSPLPYKYLTLNGVDPIAPAATSAGVFPVCAGTTYLCEAKEGVVGGVPAFNSFEHLRDGSYDSWSVYRAVTAPGTLDQTNMQQLIDVTQPIVDESLPDFVPLNPVCSGASLTPASVSGTITLNGRTTYHFSEPGLELFRSHYTRSGVTGANGAVIGTNATCASPPVSHTWHAAFVGGTTEAGGDVGGCIIVVGNNIPTAAQIAATGCM